MVNVVAGPGRTSGRARGRSRHRKISFTGTENGPAIARRRAEIKRVTLELGGKSANVVFADADLEGPPPRRRGGVRQRGPGLLRAQPHPREASAHDSFMELLASHEQAVRSATR